MKRVRQELFTIMKLNVQKLAIVCGLLLCINMNASSQTFEFPYTLFVDSLSLKQVMKTPGSDTFTVKQDAFNSMSSATSGPGFSVKSVLSLACLKVNVQSPLVGKKRKFTYMITYRTIGVTHPAGTPAVSNLDTLSVSYDGDSLKMINDKSFKIAGSYHKLSVAVFDVYEITSSGSSLTYTQLVQGVDTNVAPFVYVFGEVYLQKYVSYSSLNMSGISTSNNISTDGTVLLNWNGLSYVAPAGYEVEWTYVSPYSSDNYDFRNNATRIFTNNTSFKIPVAEKEGYLVYRVRMVRPDLNNLQARNYGPWSIGSDQGSVSSLSSGAVQIQHSASDDLNWDLKMSFVEDGKYKQVITYYDGLLKPKQVQTRFNSNPTQTIVAQSLYDHEGRAVINSLPIPVNGFSKFGFMSNFLHPEGYTEYTKLMYDAIPDPNICPPKETKIMPLDTGALSNKYYSRNNSDKTGENAFIPDAEGYPLVRKVLSPENNDKVLFEGKAGLALQLGNDRQMEYLYGSPIQAELNKFFGQDIGKANYYRKLITTDNHDQDMFTITDDEGKTVASGLISTPDTNSLALSIRNQPVNKSFHSNLLPVPNIRMDEHWFNTGSYFVETSANYGFKYQISYKPFKPCANVNVGLKPKVYFYYDVIDQCGNTVVQRNGVLGGVGITSSSFLIDSNTQSSYLYKGNHVWSKYAYIKIDDLRASVDEYLDNNYGCFSSYDSFLKQTFMEMNFPCISNYDPCNNMRYQMIKELYPGAKYGKYQYTDSSRYFTSASGNSILALVPSTDDRYYQSPCIPSTVTYGSKVYNLKQMTPQQMIDNFNDSIGAALLPLHPDYCKLQICHIINNPYGKFLAAISKAKDAVAVQRFALTDIINNDPLYTYGLLSVDDLANTMDDSFSIDSVAYKQTICGTELGVVESVCKDIFATSTPSDITQYPANVRDVYYQKLVGAYAKNREDRLALYLKNYADTCGPCASIRLTDPSEGPEITSGSDTTILVEGMDSTNKHLQQPVGSFGSYFDPVASANLNADSLAKLRSADNSIYCKDAIDYIVGTLSTCNVSASTLTALRDTLKNRFCATGRSITSLSYDSLTTIMGQVGISTNDLCNAGLFDLRRIIRMSSDYVQLGLIHYSPRYYEDLMGFIDSNSILAFIAGANDTLHLDLKLCNSFPFQQNLAQQLGATILASNCTTTHAVYLVKSLLPSANSVKLSFINGIDVVNYFMYPTKSMEYNVLNSGFSYGVISAPGNYEIETLFNKHGFDKVTQTLANRNTVVLNFDATMSSVTNRYSYFISAFNMRSDYNMMEKDEPQYLNGVGCSEFLPMVNTALTKSEQLNIKMGHPYFEKYFTNVINYENQINFDYKNYYGALVSCGVSDSTVIKKHLAHFRIKFPSGADIDDVEDLVDTLRTVDTFGIGMANVMAYKISGSQYLLLDIQETNNKNANEAKQIVLAKVPSGSVVEYLPSLSRDTVAQLFVYDIEVSNMSQFISNLSGAFPAASISSISGDFDHIVPGFGRYPLTGTRITITRSISGNYDYNHYVDAIEKYVRSIAPMTTFFTHAESAVSSQYADWQMTAWRNYVMSVTPINHNEHIKLSKADKFKILSAASGGKSFASSSFSYISTVNPDYSNNLYIDHSPTSNTNYGYIAQLLQDVESYNLSYFGKKTLLSPLPTSYSHIPALLGSGTETRTYLCGDTTQFWVNHFDANMKMINVFIQLPSFLPMSRELYKLVSISKGFEKDSVSYMNVTFAAQAGPRKDTIKCIAYTNKNLGDIYTIPSAFLSSHSKFETLSGKFVNCETKKLDALHPIAMQKYMYYRDSVKDMIVANFRQHVIDSIQEDFSIMGNDIKHGVTLYYYDMAGNLIMTVPPAGVAELDVTDPNNSNINSARANLYNSSSGSGGSVVVIGGGSSLFVPDHKKVTTYHYNAQNKVIETKTPDGGTTNNYYDLAGRVVLSQNDKQRAVTPPLCTYFVYDNLSRVIETGVVEKLNKWNTTFLSNISNSFYSDLLTKGRKEVTATIYDTASYTVAGPFIKLPPQNNLKNRVSCTKYFEAISPGINASKDTGYVNALHYSYDISGNVKTLVHDLRSAGDIALRFKRVDYEYDLYSGKVLMVAYNRGYADQFYQKYAYDSDNRIVDVQTSNNGVYWDRDAHYQYYEHGPLARTEIGENRVQGIDYAYTINGWLKAINGVQNDALNDMGTDGGTGLVTPKDVFSQRIDYFGGDYKAIADSNTFRELPATPKNLYNGNIAAIATALAPFDNIYNKYHYDPLQRIDRADYDSYTINNTTNPHSASSSLLAGFRSNYKYDPDGNLLELNRKGGDVPASMNGGTAIANHLMDSLKYHYTTGTNRLKSLADLSSSTAYNIDIPPTSLDTSLSRYEYDAIGNLTKDLVSGLTNITWTNAGKVKSITKTDGSKMFFTYDPLGNRLTKQVVKYPAPDSMVNMGTTYIRDASGNILAVYEEKKEYDINNITYTAVANSGTLIAPGSGSSSVPLGNALAEELHDVYANNPSFNLAKLVMSIPDLNDQAYNGAMMQNLISSLREGERLDFLKSMPAITAYTLSSPEGFPLTSTKLSSYMQPVLLSESLDDLQTDLLVALKNNNEPLYFNTLITVNATQTEKQNFPTDPAVLTAFKSMPLAEKLTITNGLAQSLTTEAISTLPHITPVLQTAYSSSNTSGSFVTELPNADELLDEMRQDAVNYTIYRYGLVDMEQVPLDTVAAEFNTNSVLASVLANSAPEPTPDALALIVNNNFSSLVSIAGSSGQGSNLVAALKTSILKNGTLPAIAYPPMWLKTTEVLKSHQLHLGEHHLYGSSRVGLQKYLPQEMQYHFIAGTAGGTTNTLTTTKPWYSLYGNDLFSALVYNNDLRTGTMSNQGMGITSHLLGNRHYELTNHLGNVQATVVDRASPTLRSSDSALLGYRADISTAQDYYPFGMLMPGRYISDTGKKCVTVNTTVLVPVYTKVYPTATLAPGTQQSGSGNTTPIHKLPKPSSTLANAPYIYHYNAASAHPNGQVISGALVNNMSQWSISLSEEPSGGVSAFMHIEADTNLEAQEVGFELDLPENVYAEMCVRQYVDTGEEYTNVVAWTTINTSGAQQFMVPINKAYVKAGGPTILQMTFRTIGNVNINPGVITQWKNYWTYLSHYVSQTHIATICEEKDNYRFGFNGQEKDNEPKGIGNSLDFGERIYDSRLGRFPTPDPLAKKFPWNSPYAFAINNPIRFIDVNGEEPGDVVVAFGGGDWQGKGDKGRAVNIIQRVHADYIKEKGGATRAFASKFWNVSPKSPQDLNKATDAAFKFVMANYNVANGKDEVEGGKVIIEGYSMGGVLATHLAKRLEKAGVKVDLLITVDAAAAWKTDDVQRKIPGNVKKNINIYQTKESAVGSFGGKNVAEDPTKTNVVNSDYSGYYDGEPGTDSYSEVEHGTIDDISEERVSKEIVTELKDRPQTTTK